MRPSDITDGNVVGGSIIEEIEEGFNEAGGYYRRKLKVAVEVITRGYQLQ